MPALSGITAVRTTSNTVVKKVKYGATIAAGQPLYQDSADKEYKLARSIAEATAKGGGIAITPGVDGGEHGRNAGARIRPFGDRICN